jgi:hypothetical protein
MRRHIVTQVNINDPNGGDAVERPVVERPAATTDQGAGHAVAAGINLITVLVVLAVALVIVWLIFQMIVPMIGR